MDKVNIVKGAWVVVCDGGKAFILENNGSPSALRLDTKEVHEHDNPPTHEQGSDRPGRTHHSTTNARSAVEQTDWHDVEERKFLETLARRLDAAIAAKETSDLIVIAAPRALGMIRAAYSPAVRHALRGELDKDYVKLPVREIEKHLAG
ncbi:MAG: host attachment protein [Deltaproteobacteria bacterium]|nr:host attachment protein [Deltaproteobacteria bacterium]